MKKTLIAVISAIVLVAVLAIAVSAAGISANEQKLLDKFKAGVTLEDGTVVTPPAVYITQAEQQLAKDDFTDAELAKLEKAMDEIFAIIKAEDLHSGREVKASAKYNEMVQIAEKAFDEIGYTVTPGDEVNGANIVKKTGVDMTATIVAVVALVSVLALSAAVIAKKRLLVK
ncbi:MAG: hypothetical protein IJQ53_08215 [Clostridia bacterium]|nr:hypothetical protein [Clostridia bacterium]